MQLANSAWAAGLSLLMAGDRDGAGEWLRRAADRYRESWDAGDGTDAWGRPIGAMKALLIAGEDASDAARWALDAGAAEAESPIGRYAGALALLVLGRDEEAAEVAATLGERLPGDVADALRALAARRGGRVRSRRRLDPALLRDTRGRSSRTSRFPTPRWRSTRSPRDAASARASRRRRGRGSRASCPRQPAPGCPASRATGRLRARARPRRPCPRP